MNICGILFCYGHLTLDVTHKVNKQSRPGIFHQKDFFKGKTSIGFSKNVLFATKKTELKYFAWGHAKHTLWERQSDP